MTKVAKKSDAAAGLYRAGNQIAYGNTSSWSVWKVKAGFDLNYSRYKAMNTVRSLPMPCGNMITIPICLSGVGECLPQSIMPLLTKFTASMGVRTDGNNYSDK